MINGRVPTLFLTLLVVSSVVNQLAAQQVATVEVFPDDITLELDDRVEIFAEASDSLGDFVEIAVAEWRSSDESVVSIELDMEVPGVATAIAVGSGTATVSVRIQTITTMIPVTVAGAAVAPPVAALPDSVLPPELASRALGNAVSIQVERFGQASSCRSGFFSHRAGLIVTTYTAIRGADRAEVISPSGESYGVPEVAAYDVDRNVAVLSLREARGEQLLPMTLGGPIDHAWHVGYSGCREHATTRYLSILSVDGTSGTMQLSMPLDTLEEGGAIIGRAGALLGMSLGGTAAITGNRINALLNRAVANVNADSSLSVRTVADAERHRFGSVVLSADATTASVRITPLETNHWPELARDEPLPFTLSGPAGRYRVDLLVAGQPQGFSIVRVRPGGISPVKLTENLAQLRPLLPSGEPPTQPAEVRGGKFPWRIALLGVAGAGAVIGLLVGGDGDGITIFVPFPD